MDNPDWKHTQDEGNQKHNGTCWTPLFVNNHK